MNSGFTSTSNKTLLWDVLKDTPVFINMASLTDKQEIIKIFETEIAEVAGSVNSQSLPLTELNKRFLNNIITTLKKPVHGESTSQSTSQALSQDTKSDMQQQRASLFEARLKKKQDEFYKPSVPPPPRITFKDEDDSPLDVSAHLEQMQMSRVADLEQVTFTTNQNWDFSSMKPDQTVTEAAPPLSPSPAPQLKIDHASDIVSPVDAVINKKVSWDDKAGGGNLNNFMDRLKQKKDEVNATLLGQIRTDLQEIKTIQYKILERMTHREAGKTMESPQYEA